MRPTTERDVVNVHHYSDTPGQPPTTTVRMVRMVVHKNQTGQFVWNQDKDAYDRVTPLDHGAVLWQTQAIAVNAYNGKELIAKIKSGQA